MRGEKHPSLVSPVESKRLAPTGSGPVRDVVPDVSQVPAPARPSSSKQDYRRVERASRACPAELRRFTRPREATGKHLPSLYLIALGFGRRTRQVPWRVATQPRAG